jgi:hypothetical protein
MRSFSPFLAVLLTPLMVVSPLSAQLPVAAPGNAQVDAPAQDLQIRLLETDGFQGQTNSRSEKGFAVVVANASGQVVPNVAVVFRMPDNGPTGTFGDGTHATVAYTDDAGIARFRGIQWGGTEGLVAVRITASKGSSHAGMLLEHSLSQVVASAKQAPAPKLATASLTAPTIALPQQPAETSAYVPAKPIPPPLSPGLPSGKSDAATTDLSAPRVTVTSPTATSQLPVVSVTAASPDTKIHSSSKTKWIVIAAVAAGAGIGAAMAMGKGKAGSSTTPVPGVSIGAPTVSVGNP